MMRSRESARSFWLDKDLDLSTCCYGMLPPLLEVCGFSVAHLCHYVLLARPIGRCDQIYTRANLYCQSLVVDHVSWGMTSCSSTKAGLSKTYHITFFAIRMISNRKQATNGPRQRVSWECAITRKQYCVTQTEIGFGWIRFVTRDGSTLLLVN